ncbi:acyltransferase domain-containing protein [Amycolatopsis mediterranei]|uniref:acyltransferase domain-containing protein n=1 Tax=Amycolatopsis mediterranei TaxID=33910 RepID=UPI003416E3E3
MDESRDWRLVAVSAATPAEFRRAAAALADGLALRPSAPLGEQAGPVAPRPDARYRRAFVAGDTTEAVRRLRRLGPGTGPVADEPGVVFLFPGVGDHYAGMGRGLYRREPVFRKWLDRCAELLIGELGFDLRAELYPDRPDPRPAAAGTHPSGIDLTKLLDRSGGQRPIERTLVAQPVVFAVEYALARLLLSWGITPAAMVGYSIGEYVAATVAGVLTLEDALVLVARRAKLVETVAPGGMLVVMLGREALAAYLDGELSLAAVNGPQLCVAAGPLPALRRLEQRLTADGVASVRAGTRHAFHSRMMASIEAPLADLAGTFGLAAPRIPLLSNVSGTWLTDAEATSPAYWARHLRLPVRLHDNLTEMWRLPGAVAVEVGAGRMLGGFAAQHPGRPPGEPAVLATLPAATGDRADTAAVLDTAGRLWELGCPVDLTGGDPLGTAAHDHHYLGSSS